MQATSPIFNTNLTISEIIINKEYTRFVKSHPDNSSFSPLEKTTPQMVISKIRTSDFMNKINTSGSAIDSLAILPKNCRFIRHLNGYIHAVIEDPPMLRSVKVNIRLDTEIENLKSLGLLSKFGYDDFLEENPEPPYIMQLSFPYVIYHIVFSASTGQLDLSYMKLFYRLHPLNGINDYLLTSNLLNVGSDGSVCLGDRKVSEYKNLNDKIEHIINVFWANEFNNDITTSYALYANQKEISTFLAWKYYSQTDPMFIFDVDWKKNEPLSYFLQTNKHNVDKTTEVELNKLHNIISFNDVNSGTTTVDRRYSANSVCLSNNKESGIIYLVTGDEILIEGKKYFIYEIKYNNSGNDTPILVLEDEEGTISEQQFDVDLQQKIKEEIVSNKDLKSIEVDGLTITPGTILEATDGYSKRLKKVLNIRKTRDGQIELKCDKTFYCVENGSLIGVKIFDQDNLSFSNGVKAVKKNKYIIFREANSHVFDIQFLKFNDISIERDEIIYKFENLVKPIDKDIDSNVYYTGQEQSEIINYDKSIADDIPSVFRMGNILLSNTDPNLKCRLIKGMGFGISNTTGTRIDKYNFGRRMIINSKLILSEILKDNSLRIKSFDLDIELDIGDTIVIADYSQSVKYITTVRTITGFKVENDKLFVDTVDENYNPLSIDYINFKNNEGDYLYSKSPKIKIGLIRKIIDSDIFKHGMKVRAKVAKIPMFKKKDVYEVIGVIIDSGSRPFILCSNGHTIWCDNKAFEDFEFIGTDSKLYNKTKLTEIGETEKVLHKYQSGDIVNYSYRYNSDTDHYNPNDLICNVDTNTNRVYFKNSPYLCQITSSYKQRVDKSHLMWYKTIPIPRYMPETRMINTGIIPNGHGWFTFKENSNTKIMLEKTNV